MGKTYQVFVIGLEGKTYTIDIGESEDDFKSMTVLSLKKKVVAKLSSGVGGTGDLRMLFTKHQLKDRKKLADYGIKDKSTILGVVRLVGGGL